MQLDIHALHDIEQKEALSNDKTSVDIANELTFGSQKQRKKSSSPDRIIQGPSPLQKIPGFVGSNTLKTAISSLALRQVHEAASNNRYSGRNPRLRSAAATGQGGIATKNAVSQKILKTQGKFYTRL